MPSLPRLASRPRRRAAAVLAGGLLVALALPAFAQQAPVVDLKFEKYSLANGLEVILREDHRLPLVGVNTWFHVGAANEVAGRTGFAHLFEHMMFSASGHVPDGQYFKILQSAGASLVNGSTSLDRTNYMEDVPANQLETALWMESDRMGFLLDHLDDRMLARQQDVVRNERRQRTENPPYALAREAVYHLLFPRTHPYYANVIGSHADIQAAQLKDVHDFFRRYYAPNNATLCIVGDFETARVKALVEKYYGSIPRGLPVPPIDAKTPPITGERRQVVTDKVELPRVFMAWLTPAIFQPGDAAAELAGRVLSGGKTSRLYESLVYRQKIAQDVSARQQPLALGSIFQISATAKPGHTAEELERAIDAELAKLAADGPTSAELDAARAGVWTDNVIQLEPVGGFNGVANTLNQYNHFAHDPGRFNWDQERYAQVTTDAVRQFAAGQLRRDARVIVQCVPGEKVAPPGPPTPPFPPEAKERVVSAEPWRDAPPSPGAMPTTPLPAAQRFQLANGLAVFLVENHQLPVVAARLVLRAGSASDPAGREGLAAFTAAMLDEGAGKRDALDLARDLERGGVSLNTSAGLDGSFVSGQALKANLGVLMDAMSDVVLRPAFPAAEVERVRGDRLTGLLQQRDDQTQIAQRVAARVLYGDAHPYGHLPAGTEAAVTAISRDNLLGFWRGSYAPGSAALVLTGDLTAAEARRWAEQAFGAWTGAARTAVRPPAPAPLSPGVYVVDKPGATQTMLFCGQPAVPRDDADFEALRVMNMILGGNFASRLNLNLREAKGYTYGARTVLDERRGVAPFFASSSVQGDKTGPSLVEVFQELGGIGAGEVKPEELTLAKEALTRTLPASFQTSNGTADAVGNLFLFDLPPDYYQNLTARVQALTAGDILAVARRHVDPTRLAAVLVGDAKSILPQLSGLDHGPVTLLGTDGKPAPAPAPTDNK